MLSKEAALLRVSTAKTSREVLDLTAGEVLSGPSLHTQYRKLAVLVHPDKNEAVSASSCFLKLKDAYESLLAEVDAKGNVYVTPSDGRDFVKKRKAHAHSRSSGTEKFKTFSEIFTEEDMNDHAEKWKRFCAGASPAAEAETRTSSPTKPDIPTPTEDADEKNQQRESFVCLLCKRRFKTSEQQKRHILQSALHKANVVAQNA